MRDMDRDSAVVALNQMGFVAQARDWAMGRTVFVTLPELEFEHAGIRGARDAVYLREDPEAWGVVPMNDTEWAFSTLGEAARFMLSWLDCGLAIHVLEKRGREDSMSAPCRVTRVMRGLARPWCIAGGWALDLFLGTVSREHGDVDVALFREDQGALRQHLSGWTLRKAEDGALSDWREGESLQPPVHEVHATRVGLRMELLLNEREGDTWVYRRDARVRMPVERLILRAEPGLPVLCPEVVLLYKAKAPRAVDTADFEAVRSRLSESQRQWLREALDIAHPSHPWSAALTLR